MLYNWVRVRTFPGVYARQWAQSKGRPTSKTFFIEYSLIHKLFGWFSNEFTVFAPTKRNICRMTISWHLGRVKKISCLSSEIFDEIWAGGRIFFLFFMYSVCGLCEQSRSPLRNGRCCSVLYVAASVTGSTGSAAYTWPTLTKIKTQQEYIRISYVLLLIKNPARALRPQNGNSSIHQVPTLSIFLALFYPYACNGPPSGLEQCSVKLVDFLSRRLSSTFPWNKQGIVCPPSRIPVFLKKKKKKITVGQENRGGRSGMINNYFFYSALVRGQRADHSVTVAEFYQMEGCCWRVSVRLNDLEVGGATAQVENEWNFSEWTQEIMCARDKKIHPL